MKAKKGDNDRLMKKVFQCILDNPTGLTTTQIKGKLDTGNKIGYHHFGYALYRLLRRGAVQMFPIYREGGRNFVVHTPGPRTDHWQKEWGSTSDLGSDVAPAKTSGICGAPHPMRDDTCCSFPAGHDKKDVYNKWGELCDRRHSWQ